MNLASQLNSALTGITNTLFSSLGQSSNELMNRVSEFSTSSNLDMSSRGDSLDLERQYNRNREERTQTSFTTTDKVAIAGIVGTLAASAITTTMVGVGFYKESRVERLKILEEETQSYLQSLETHKNASSDSYNRHRPGEVTNEASVINNQRAKEFRTGKNPRNERRLIGPSQDPNFYPYYTKRKLGGRGYHNDDFVSPYEYRRGKFRRESGSALTIFSDLAEDIGDLFHSDLDPQARVKGFISGEEDPYKLLNDISTNPDSNLSRNKKARRNRPTRHRPTTSDVKAPQVNATKKVMSRQDYDAMLIANNRGRRRGLGTNRSNPGHRHNSFNPFSKIGDFVNNVRDAGGRLMNLGGIGSHLFSALRDRILPDFDNDSHLWSPEREAAMLEESDRLNPIPSMGKDSPSTNASFGETESGDIDLQNRMQQTNELSSPRSVESQPQDSLERHRAQLNSDTANNLRLNSQDNLRQTSAIQEPQQPVVSTPSQADPKAIPATTKIQMPEDLSSTPNAFLGGAESASVDTQNHLQQTSKLSSQRSVEIQPETNIPKAKEINSNNESSTLNTRNTSLDNSINNRLNPQNLPRANEPSVSDLGKLGGSSVNPDLVLSVDDFNQRNRHSEYGRQQPLSEGLRGQPVYSSPSNRPRLSLARPSPTSNPSPYRLVNNKINPNRSRLSRASDNLKPLTQPTEYTVFKPDVISYNKLPDGRSSRSPSQALIDITPTRAYSRELDGPRALPPSSSPTFRSSGLSTQVYSSSRDGVRALPPAPPALDPSSNVYSSSRDGIRALPPSRSSVFPIQPSQEAIQAQARLDIRIPLTLEDVIKFKNGSYKNSLETHILSNINPYGAYYDQYNSYVRSIINENKNSLSRNLLSDIDPTNEFYNERLGVQQTSVVDLYMERNSNPKSIMEVHVGKHYNTAQARPISQGLSYNTIDVEYSTLESRPINYYTFGSERAYEQSQRRLRKLHRDRYSSPAPINVSYAENDLWQETQHKPKYMVVDHTPSSLNRTNDTWERKEKPLRLETDNNLHSVRKKRSSALDITYRDSYSSVGGEKVSIKESLEYLDQYNEERLSHKAVRKGEDIIYQPKSASSTSPRIEGRVLINGEKRTILDNRSWSGTQGPNYIYNPFEDADTLHLVRNTDGKAQFVSISNNDVVFNPIVEEKLLPAPKGHAKTSLIDSMGSSGISVYSYELEMSPTEVDPWFDKDEYYRKQNRLNHRQKARSNEVFNSIDSRASTPSVKPWGYDQRSKYRYTDIGPENVFDSSISGVGFDRTQGTHLTGSVTVDSKGRVHVPSLMVREDGSKFIIQRPDLEDTADEFIRPRNQVRRDPSTQLFLPEPRKDSLIIETYTMRTPASPEGLVVYGMKEQYSPLDVDPWYQSTTNDQRVSKTIRAQNASMKQERIGVRMENNVLVSTYRELPTEDHYSKAAQRAQAFSKEAETLSNWPYDYDTDSADQSRQKTLRVWEEKSLIKSADPELTRSYPANTPQPGSLDPWSYQENTINIPYNNRAESPHSVLFDPNPTAQRPRGGYQQRGDMRPIVYQALLPPSSPSSLPQQAADFTQYKSVLHSETANAHIRYSTLFEMAHHIEEGTYGQSKLIAQSSLPNPQQPTSSPRYNRLQMETDASTNAVMRLGYQYLDDETLNALGRRKSGDNLVMKTDTQSFYRSIKDDGTIINTVVERDGTITTYFSNPNSPFRTAFRRNKNRLREERAIFEVREAEGFRPLRLVIRDGDHFTSISYNEKRNKYDIREWGGSPTLKLYPGDESAPWLTPSNPTGYREPIDIFPYDRQRAIEEYNIRNSGVAPLQRHRPSSGKEASQATIDVTPLDSSSTASRTPFTRPSSSSLIVRPSSDLKVSSPSINNIPPNKSKQPIAGFMGNVLVGTALLGTLFHGPDFLPNLFTRVTGIFRNKIVGDPYKYRYDERGMPLFPTDGNPIGGFTRRDTYIGGVQVTDPTEADFTKGDSRYNLETLAHLTVGAAVGYGTLTALDKFSEMSINNRNTYGEVFEGIFESKYKTTGTPAFGRNFAPLLIGAAVGGILEASDGNSQGIVGGIAAGAMVGSFVGYMTMKEPTLTNFHRKLGVPLIGAFAALMVANRRKDSGAVIYNRVGDNYNVTYKDTAERIRTGQSEIPFDLYANPYNEDIINAFRNKESDFDLSRRYIQNPESYANLERFISKEQISSDFIDDLIIPDYQQLNNYNLVRHSDRKELSEYDMQKDSMESLSSGFMKYQLGYIAPMLTVVGAAGFLKTKPGKKLGSKVSKALGLMSSYELKTDLIYPGEEKIGRSFSPLVKGLLKRDNDLIEANIKGFKAGMAMKVKGEFLSTAKSLSVYAPLFIIAGTITNKLLDNSVKQGQESHRISHWEGFYSSFEGSEDEGINNVLNLQKYLLEGQVSYIGEDAIFYDSANIGKGFRDFLLSSPDNSLKALLYKTGGDRSLLEILERKAQDQGIGISGGGAINPSITDNLKDFGRPNTSHMGYALAYPFQVARQEGLGAGIGVVTSPIIGTISNNIVTSLGLSQPFGTGEQEGNALGNIINTGSFGLIGFVSGGLITKSRKGALLLGIGSALLGAHLPNRIDPYFYAAVKQQGSHLIESPKAYLRHQALTEDRGHNVTLGIASSAAVGGAIGLTMGSFLGKQSRLKRGIKGGIAGAIAGVAMNSISSFMSGDGLIPNFSSGIGSFLTGGVDMRDKSFSILSGGGYRRGQYSHIHSKVLWNDRVGQEEVFLSTGNLETIWNTRPGKEKQFNLAVRIRGEQAQRLTSQLNLLHEFTKTMEPNTAVEDFKAIADQMPDFILGGEGAQSIEKLIDFVNTSEGELMLSAPYMALSDSPEKIEDLVKSFENAIERGQRVIVIGQHPRGVSSGGRPDLTERLQRRLISMGAEVYLPDQASEALAHAKFIADANRSHTTSHNIFSKNSSQHVLELGMTLHGAAYAQATKQAAMRFAINNNYRRVNSEVGMGRELLDTLGVSPHFMPMFEEDKGNALISSRMGASFFYARSQYNNAQRNARNHHRVQSYKTAGPVGSMYKMAYLARETKNNDFLTTDLGLSNSVEIPGVIQRFDKELLTPGLGSLLNERVFSPLGMGRVYKDEIGFLPSIAGTIGAVLDRTMLYHSSGNIPGINTQEQPLQSGFITGYKEDGAAPMGFFEAVLSEGTHLLESAAVSVMFYAAVGEPMSVLFSEAFKSDTEDLIRLGLNSDIQKFHSNQARIARRYSLGIEKSYSNPFEARFAVNRIILDESKNAFYDTSNFAISPYHAGSTFLRRRSSLLLQDVMKPFLMDYVSPYLDSDEAGRLGFSRVIDKMIESVNDPVDIEVITSQASRKDLVTIAKRVNKFEADLHTLDVEISSKDLSNALGLKQYREDFLRSMQQSDSISNTNLLDDAKIQELIEDDNKFLNHLEERVQKIRTEIGSQVRAIENDSSLSYLEKQSRKNSLLRQATEKYLGGIYDTSDLNKVSYDPTDLTRYGRLTMGMGTGEDNSLETVIYSIKNVGIERSSRVARNIQDILDEIPLHPGHWRLFNKYPLINNLVKGFKGGYKRVVDTDGVVKSPVRVIGDVFSIDIATNTIRDALFGTGGLDDILNRYEIVSNPYSGLNTRGQKIVDRLNTGWNILFRYPVDVLKRTHKRFKVIHGYGSRTRSVALDRATEARKLMEYTLAGHYDPVTNRRGISWGDDLERIQEFRKKAEIAVNKLLVEANITDLSNISVEERDRLAEKIQEPLNIKHKDNALRFLNRGQQQVRDHMINRYLSIHMDTNINPLARRVTHINSSVHNAIAKSVEVSNRLKELDRGGIINSTELIQSLRDDQVGLFSAATMSKKNLHRRLDRVPEGVGSMVTKHAARAAGFEKLGYLAVIGVLIGRDLFQSTGGPGLVSQLYTSLFLGGSFSTQQKDKEVSMNIQFEADRFGFQSLLGLDEGPSRYLSQMATTGLSLGVAYWIGTSMKTLELTETALDLATVQEEMLRLSQSEGQITFGFRYKGTTDIFIPDLDKGETAEVIGKRARAGGKGLELVYENLSNSTLSYVKSVRYKGSDLVMDMIGTKGKTLRNTMIAYSLINLGSKGVNRLASSFLNTMRNTNDGSLDPLLGGMVGAAIGSNMRLGRSRFSSGLIGALIGSVGMGLANRLYNFKLANIGGPGSLVNSVDASIQADLSDFRYSVLSNLDKASRVELMATLWAGEISNIFGFMHQDPYGTGVEVSAKQVSMPVLQFFYATKTVGKRVDAQGNVTDPGETYITAGIQGPPITGTSLAVQMPFKIVNKGASIFGFNTRLAMNEETNMMDWAYNLSSLTTSIYASSLVLSALGQGWKEGQNFLTRTVNPGMELATTNNFITLGRATRSLAGAIDKVGQIPMVAAHSVISSMTTVDQRLMYEALPASRSFGATKINSPASHNPRFISGLTKSFATKLAVGMLVGSVIGGMIGPSSAEPHEMQTAKASGMLAGAALGGLALPSVSLVMGRIHKDLFLMSDEIHSNPSLKGITNVKVGQAYKLMNYMDRAKGKIAPFALAALAGSFMTDENYGFSRGMGRHNYRGSLYTERERDALIKDKREDLITDPQLEDNVRWITTVGLYTAAVGTTLSQIGRLGLSPHTAIEQYHDIRFNKLPGISNTDNWTKNLLSKVQKSYYNYRLHQLEEDVHDTIRALQNQQRDIDQYNVLVKRRVGDDLSRFTKIHHISEAAELVADKTPTQVMNQVENTSLLKIAGHLKLGGNAVIARRLRPKTFTRRVMKGGLAVVIGTRLVGSMISGILGQNDLATKVYDAIEGNYRDSSLTNNFNNTKTHQIIQGFRDGVANALRLFTGIDPSIDSGQFLDRTFTPHQLFSRGGSQVTARHLARSSNENARAISGVYQNLQEMFVLDDINAFANFPGGFGITFRSGDKGYVTAPYIQLQGTGSDVSAAAYTMASKFLFRNAMQGENDFFFELKNAMKLRDGEVRTTNRDDSSVRRLVAQQMLGVTARLAPRKKARRFSSLNQETIAALSSDSLLTSALAYRTSTAKNLAYQPLESLVTRMWIEQTSTNHRFYDQMLVDILRGDETMKNMLLSDPFYLVSRSFNMLSIKFFGENTEGQFNIKNRYKGYNSGTELSKAWDEWDTPYMDTYLPEEFDLLDSEYVNILGRLASSVPGVGFILPGAVVTGALVTALSSLGAFSEAKEMTAKSKALYEAYESDWFSNLNPESSSRRSMWKVANFPTVGTGIPLQPYGDNLPILYKGNYAVKLNSDLFFSYLGTNSQRLIQDAFDIVTEDLDKLFHNGKRVVPGEDPVSLVNYFQDKRKIKELENIVKGTHLPASGYSDLKGKALQRVNVKESLENNIKALQQRRLELERSRPSTLVNADTLQLVNLNEQGQLDLRSLYVNRNVDKFVDGEFIPNRLEIGINIKNLDNAVPINEPSNLLFLDDSSQQLLDNNPSITPRNLDEALEAVEQLRELNAATNLNLRNLNPEDIRLLNQHLSTDMQIRGGGVKFIRDDTLHINPNRSVVENFSQVIHVAEETTLDTPGFTKPFQTMEGTIEFPGSNQPGGVDSFGRPKSPLQAFSTLPLDNNLPQVSNLSDLNSNFGSALNPLQSEADEIDSALNILRNRQSQLAKSNPELILSSIKQFYVDEISQLSDDFVDILANRKVTITKEMALKAPSIQGDEDAIARVSALFDESDTREISVLHLFADDDANIERLIKGEVSAEELMKGVRAASEVGLDSKDTIGRLKDFYRDLLSSELERVILDEIDVDAVGLTRGNSNILRHGGSTTLGDAIFQLNEKILLSLKGVGLEGKQSFFGRIINYWGGLSTSPSHDVVRALKASYRGATDFVQGVVSVMERPVQGTLSALRSSTRYLIGDVPVSQSGIASNTEYMSRVREQVVQTSRANRGVGKEVGKASRGLMNLWEIYGVAGDIVEGASSIAAFSRLGSGYVSGDLTEAQLFNKAYEAGFVMNKAITGIGISLALLGLLKGGGTLAATAAAALSLPVAAVGSAIALAGIGLVVGGYFALGKGGRQWMAEKWTTGWEGFSQLSGKVVHGVANTTRNMTQAIVGDAASRRITSGVVSGIGGGLAGSILGLGAATMSLLFATASAPLIAGGMVMGAAIGFVGAGLLGMVAPEATSNLFTSLISSASKIRIGKFPLFAAFITQEGDWFRSQRYTPPVSGTSKHYSVLSPATVGQAIQEDHSTHLVSAKDISGRSSANLFLNPTIYGSYIGPRPPEHQKYGSISIIRPTSLTDALISRELALRGQYYNHDIIGRQVWHSILQTSSNRRDVYRAMNRYALETPKAAKDLETLISLKNVEVTPRSKSQKIAELAISVSSVIKAKEEIHNYEEGEDKLNRGNVIHVQLPDVEKHTSSNAQLKDLGLNSMYNVLSTFNNGNSVESIAKEDNDLLMVASGVSRGVEEEENEFMS